MGTVYGSENKENEYENNIDNNENESENNNLNISNIKAPEFYLNIFYPNQGNRTLKDIINNYLEGKSDSFKKINNNYKDDLNLLVTPKFNTKCY